MTREAAGPPHRQQFGAGQPAQQGTAREQVARLLTLVPFLHSRRGAVRLEDAADALGTTPQQVLADLKVLLMCGLPGGFPDDLIDVDLDALEEPGGDGVIRVSNADYLARPLRLTPTEASALVVALRAVRAGADERTLEVVDRATAKLEAVAAEGSVPSAVVDPPGGPIGEAAGLPDAELLPPLEDAVARGRQLRLRYYVPARDEVSERVVDPRGVVTHRDRRYLDAWCHSAEAPRLFRLDRIGAAEVLDSAITTDRVPPRDLETEGLFSTGDSATRVLLRLAPPAQWVPEYYPVEEQRRLPDGALEVVLLVGDPRWLERLVLRLAPHAAVVAPAELAERAVDAAREALRRYQ